MQIPIILPIKPSSNREPLPAISSVGGKGANLAKLARASFPVPDGFLITTEAYRTFVAANELEDAILALAGTVRADDPASLESVSSAIRARLDAGVVPTGLAEQIRDAYATIGQPAVAVRSSATAEDLPEMSFAGQQDTYLNVCGDQALMRVIISCWSSLWTARALAYRARNGIAPEDVALAVVVQRMVQSEAAGVLFTANPLTGKRSEVVIDATLGLGEALVSGQVEPDQYVVDALSGHLVRKTLGSKTTKENSHHRSLSTQPRAASPTRDAARTQALPDAAIADLARLGLRVAETFGAPQDIEWAWADGELFLVQTRPITSLYPLPEGLPAEPLHVLLSFGTVQGVLDPLTPLGRDVLGSAAANVAGLFGLQRTLETQGVFRTAGERLFLDISPLIRNQTGRRILRQMIHVVGPSLGQSMQALWDDPRLAAEEQRAPGARPHRGNRLSVATITALARFFLPVLARAIQCLIFPVWGRRRLQMRVRARLAAVKAQHAAATTLAQQVALLQHTLNIVGREIIPHAGPRLVAGMTMFGIVQRQMGKLHPAASPNATTGDTGGGLEITRGLPYNVTTEMDLTLWAAARKIRQDPDSAARFDQAAASTLASEALAGRLPPVAQAAVDDFLKQYGMRSAGEIDLGRPRWRDDPTPIMQVLKSYIHIDPSQAPDRIFERGASAADKAIQQLVQAMRQQKGGWYKAPLLKFAAGRMRALAGLRESPKFFVVQLLGISHDALLASGHQLAATGVLDQPDDLFYLHLPELIALANGDPRDWTALIGERRQSYAREKARHQVPNVLLSDGQAFYGGAGVAATSANGLAGSPVSPGMAEGTVHVVMDPHDVQLAPGEILVCPATDPGWTPLFLAAGGLVMEVGGLMTHGSVVAREYGIPAVVGVQDATTRLHTGQRVRIDGSTGQIVVLS